MAITQESVITSITSIVEALYETKPIADAIKSIHDALENVEISTEERDKIYTAYMQQLSVALLTPSVDLAQKIPLLILEEKKLDAESEKAVYDKLQSLASLKKNFGYMNATEAGLGDDSKDGLVDRQIEGFFKDQVYKGLKTFSDQSAMLAQNDIPTPVWMVDMMKIATEILSNGKINLRVEGTGDTAVTVVEYDGDAEGPNGLTV